MEDATERAYQAEAARILAAQRDAVETSPARPGDEAGEANALTPEGRPHVKHDDQGRMTN